ncbi:serine hydrolase domain-containing protein [Paractinoplanes globisporus]|uniref:Serine hydrolase domain-containing protein n=1 Tax=Paractinoplanes globisporus TaxID=113565 RepID=A0ABW6W7D8_9ACTN|nr:serine hydrolase domain-containing protein [Actinoplanes globisporus]
MLQKLVQEAIDEQVSSGREKAVQVAVYRDGELIVDAVAGPADSSSLFYTWSMGKAMTATIVHRLVERGVFDYSTTIASVWPAFGAADKSGVTLRHVLQHTAGVPGVGTSTTISDICHWDVICERIAESALWWEPGTQVGYHAYTFGYILGEFCRRAAGKPLGDLLRDEIGTPLGVAEDLWFGMPEAPRSRLVPLVDSPPPPGMSFELPPDSPMARASSAELWPAAALGNRPDVLGADIPAGGKMTARAMARLYAALIGPVDGVRLLSPGTVEAIGADTYEGIDQVFGNPARFGLGFALGRLGGGEGDTSFGWGGMGGSFGYADPATGTAVAYCKNLQTDFANATEIVELVNR